MADTEERRVWGIHTPEESLFLQGSLIAIGWREMGDLGKLTGSRESFRERYVAVYPWAKKGSVATGAEMLYRFMIEMRIGDYIIYPSKSSRQINIGIVEGEYCYQENAEKYRHQRAVKWLKHLPRVAFSQGALYEVGSAMTFFSVKICYAF